MSAAFLVDTVVNYLATVVILFFLSREAMESLRPFRTERKRGRF